MTIKLFAVLSLVLSIQVHASWAEPPKLLPLTEDDLEQAKADIERAEGDSRRELCARLNERVLAEFDADEAAALSLLRQLRDRMPQEMREKLIASYQEDNRISISGYGGLPENRARVDALRRERRRTVRDFLMNPGNADLMKETDEKGFRITDMPFDYIPVGFMATTPYLFLGSMDDQMEIIYRLVLPDPASEYETRIARADIVNNFYTPAHITHLRYPKEEFVSRFVLPPSCKER